MLYITNKSNSYKKNGRKPAVCTHLMSALWSSALSGFRLALHSHRMFFSFCFALFWTDLQQPVQFPVVGKWLLFFSNSVWIRAFLSPSILFLFVILTCSIVLLLSYLRDLAFPHICQCNNTLQDVPSPPISVVLKPQFTHLNIDKMINIMTKWQLIWWFAGRKTFRSRLNLAWVLKNIM